MHPEENVEASSNFYFRTEYMVHPKKKKKKKKFCSSRSAYADVSIKALCVPRPDVWPEM